MAKHTQAGRNTNENYNLNLINAQATTTTNKRASKQQLISRTEIVTMCFGGSK